jgi:folylpolyglutamate synthase
MKWFKRALEKNAMKEKAINVLLFHCTADRDPATLLTLIVNECQFETAIFCPTKLLPSLDVQNDSTNLNQSDIQQWQKCLKTGEIWNSLVKKETAEMFNCIQESWKRVQALSENNARVNVLVTGSLHLVGGVLSFIDPQASL